MLIKSEVHMHVIKPFHLLIFVFLFGAVWFSSGALKVGVKHYAEVDSGVWRKNINQLKLHCAACYQHCSKDGVNGISLRMHAWCVFGDVCANSFSPYSLLSACKIQVYSVLSYLELPVLSHQLFPIWTGWRRVVVRQVEEVLQLLAWVLGLL